MKFCLAQCLSSSIDDQSLVGIVPLVYQDWKFGLWWHVIWWYQCIYMRGVIYEQVVHHFISVIDAWSEVRLLAKFAARFLKFCFLFLLCVINLWNLLVFVLLALHLALMHTEYAYFFGAAMLDTYKITLMLGESLDGRWAEQCRIPAQSVYLWRWTCSVMILSFALV